ncbi:unnamed protein product [Amoebophrya sp. A25]|nr:unnamed protein product [Amoebophrya sp. A25]|eukprot:GSA25T00015872001.1
MNRLTISEEQKAFFHNHGFVVLDTEPLIKDSVLLEALKIAFECCFRGDFDTGIYPDEWHWRQGISRPDAVREICNGWKSDAAVRRVVLSEEVGSLGPQLFDHWQSSRVAQDDLLWKVPASVSTSMRSTGAGSTDAANGFSLAAPTHEIPKEEGKNDTTDNPHASSSVGYHIDSDYISKQFLPTEDNSITVWIPLDDADVENGVLEFVAGSHKYETELEEAKRDLKARDEGGSSFHGGGNALLDALREKAKRTDHHANNASTTCTSEKNASTSTSPAPLSVARYRIPAGYCSIHHQNTLHGSGPNRSPLRHRRALVVHLLDGSVRFRADPDYIYGRYKLNNSAEVREEFFPTTWRITNL